MNEDILFATEDQMAELNQAQAEEAVESEKYLIFGCKQNIFVHSYALSPRQMCCAAEWRLATSRMILILPSPSRVQPLMP